MEKKPADILQEHFANALDPKLQALYVDPLAGTELNTDQESAFNLIERLSIELVSPEEHNRSWLILGDSGSGKTSFCHILCQGIWSHPWSSEDDQRIPIYIHLPSVKNNLDNILDYHLRTTVKLESYQIRDILRKRVILILDGFDELPPDKRTNLYDNNGEHWELLDIKVVITCRPEAINRMNSIDTLFCMPDYSLEKKSKFKQFYIQPFLPSQIVSYVVKYISGHQNDDDHWNKHETYMDWINKIESLEDLVSCPMLLSLIIANLQKLITKYSLENTAKQIHLTRSDILEVFTDQWFSDQALRIKRQKYTVSPGPLTGLQGNLEGYLYAYSCNLASRLMVNNKLNTELLDDNQTLDPTLLEPTDNPDQLRVYEKVDKDIFIGKAIRDPMEKERHIRSCLEVIRSGCLLRTQGEQFQFIHKSIVEYLAARDVLIKYRGLYNTYVRDITGEKLDSDLICRISYREEPEIVQRAAEIVCKDQEFKKLLFEIVMATTETPGLEIAAGNAITILNYAGVSFDDFEYRNVQIKDSDLRGASCKGTNFRAASLEGAWLDHICLSNAKLEGSNLRGVQFNKPLRIIPMYANNELQSYCKPHIAYMPNLEILIIANGNYVETWTADFSTRLSIYKHSQTALSVIRVESVYISVDPQSMTFTLTLDSKVALVFDFEHEQPIKRYRLQNQVKNFGHRPTKLHENRKLLIICSKEQFAVVDMMNQCVISIVSGYEWDHLKSNNEGSKLLIVEDVLYILPHNLIFLDKFHETIREVYFKGEYIIICSDYNILCYDTSSKKEASSFRSKRPMFCFAFAHNINRIAYCIKLESKKKIDPSSVAGFFAGGSSIKKEFVQLYQVRARCLFSFNTSKKLDLKDVNITQAIGLSSENTSIYKQKGSVGEPAPLDMEYVPFCTLFKPIPGTASVAGQPSTINTKNPKAKQFNIDENIWVLSIARNRDGVPNPLSDELRRDSSQHVFLLLEGIKNHRRFFIKADLVIAKGTPNANIRCRPFAEETELYEKFSVAAKDFEAQQWQISSQEGMKLLENIQEDQQRVILYTQTGRGRFFSKPVEKQGAEYHSCVSWARKQISLLKELNFRFEDRWYHCIAILPRDVTRQVSESKGFKN